jgi:CheY-like chemotaxis protein
VPTILAIDDSVIGLTARTKLLERSGYSVLSATDGKKALSLFESQAVDLVLMDYYIPGGGHALRQRMKAARPQTPIVILSGAIEVPEDLSNVDLFLSKLERPQTILAKIAELLPDPQQKAA